MDGAVRSGERAAARGARRAVRRAPLIAARRCSRRCSRAAPAAGAQRARFDTRLLALIPPPGLPRAGLRAPQRPRLRGHLREPGRRQLPLARVRVRPATARCCARGRSRARTCEGPRRAGGDQRRAGAARPARQDAGARAAARPAHRRLRQYATFADLAPCPPLQARTDCSPTLEDRDPMPNYAAWGPDGSLYVTDYPQAVLWRVPPGGGEARGLARRPPPRRRRVRHHRHRLLAADRRTLLIAQGSSAGLGGRNPATGKIYAVEIRRTARPASCASSGRAGPPTGRTASRSRVGPLYMPLAGAANQIAVVAPDGRELERFPSAAGAATTARRCRSTPPRARASSAPG